MDHKLSLFSLSLCLSDICLFSSYFIYLLTSRNSLFLFYYVHVFTLCWVDHSRFNVSIYKFIPLHYFMCNTRYYYFIVLCSINLILFVLLIFADLVLGFSHHLPFFMNFICFCCVLLVCIKAFCDHVDNDFYSHLIRYNDIQ